MCSLEINTEHKFWDTMWKWIHYINEQEQSRSEIISLCFKITFVKDVKNNDLEYNIMNAFMSVHACIEGKLWKRLFSWFSWFSLREASRAIQPFLNRTDCR